MGDIAKAVAVTISALVVAAVVIVGGWQAGWWFTTHNTDREARNYQNQYGKQNMLVENTTSDIATVLSITTQIKQAGDDKATVAALTAQRKAVMNKVCDEAKNITGTVPLGQDAQTLVAANCFAGSIKPGSEYDTNQ